jgi:hypothetical protein
MDLLLDKTASTERIFDGSLPVASLGADRVLPRPIDGRTFAKSSFPTPSPQVIAWMMTVQIASYSIGFCYFSIVSGFVIEMRSAGRIPKARFRPITGTSADWWRNGQHTRVPCTARSLNF